MKFLGETFDIHGGGKDLIFPHHENEIAQSEAANGAPFVRYWLHNGFVNINAEKMSKSLGNFFTIKEVLEKYDAEVLRFFLLSAHYRSPIDFSDQNLKEAAAGLERIYGALSGIGQALAQGGTRKDDELAEKAGTLYSRFREAMDDDFNTAQALGFVFDLVRTVNRVLAEGGADVALLAQARDSIRQVGAVLGIVTSEPDAFIARLKSRKAAELPISPDEIERLIQERLAARKARDFVRADEIRDLLAAQGIMLLDSAQGTTWNVK
jgi:cysteinyl-tRNA synthetase